MYPVKFIKMDYSMMLISGIIDWILSIFIIQILAFIVWSIQSKNMFDFNHWIILFIIIVIINIINVYISSIYFAKSYSKLAYILSNIYLGKFIKLDNNKIESLWTWKANSILYKWNDNWSSIVINNFVDLIVNLLAILYAFATILFTVWFKYFIIVSVVFVLIINISYFWMTKTLILSVQKYQVV